MAKRKLSPWKPGQIMARVRTFEGRCKRATKELGAYNYTPQTSRTLANVLCELTEDPDRRQEVLALFSRIANGEHPFS